MNYSTYRFTLDIHKTKSQVSIPVLFQDTGTQFYINLTDGGKPYKLTEGSSVKLYGKKPMFHVDTGKYDTLLEDCEVIDGGTRIRYVFSKQTTTQLGSVACELRLYQDGLLLTSPAFEILVEARVIEDDEIIESADERTALDRIFESEAARATAEAERVEAEAERVEAEAERVEAEAERVEAEAERVEAEAERVEAEAERGRAIEELKGEGLHEMYNSLAKVQEHLREHSSLITQNDLDISLNAADIENSKQTIHLNREYINQNTEAIKSIKDNDIPEIRRQLIEYTDAELAKIRGSDTVYVEDSEPTRIKKIPSGAYPFAFVNEIGGKTENVSGYGDNIATLSAYGDEVTLADGVFSVTVPPTGGGYDLFSGCDVSATLNPYVTYTLEEKLISPPAGCNISIEFYVSGEDEQGESVYLQNPTLDSFTPYNHGIVKNCTLGVDLSYYSNSNTEAKTVKLSMALKPKIEKLVPTPVTAVISQGRNLVDDVDFFISRGMEKQPNGFWKGIQSSDRPIMGTFWENTHRIEGQFTISATGRCLTSGNNKDTSLMFTCRYTDGSTDLWLALPSETSTVIATTKAGRTVERFSTTYMQYGTFEIKDLMINIGATALPYEPYAVSERAISTEITSLAGYGEGLVRYEGAEEIFFNNVVNFDELTYSRKVGHKVFTGASTEGWTLGEADWLGEGRFAAYIVINDKRAYPTNPSVCNYFYNESEGDTGTFEEDFAVGDAKSLRFITDISGENQWRAWLAALNEYGAPLTVVYKLDRPETINISEASDINPITIADGDLVIFANEANQDMPNTIEYVKRVKGEDE